MHMGIDTITAQEVVDPRLATGLHENTAIRTLAGDISISDLKPGAKVITRDSGYAILRDIRSTATQECAILIKSGSLGHFRPEKNTYVMPGTQIHIRDWRAVALFGSRTANVPAQRLIDGGFVVQSEIAMSRTYDLVFDHPHVVYANGMEILITA